LEAARGQPCIYGFLGQGVDSCSTDQTDRRLIPNIISRIGMPVQRGYTEDNDMSLK
jgi:hypothetical protein